MTNPVFPDEVFAQILENTPLGQNDELSDVSTSFRDMLAFPSSRRAKVDRVVAKLLDEIEDGILCPFADKDFVNDDSDKQKIREDPMLDPSSFRRFADNVERLNVAVYKNKSEWRAGLSHDLDVFVAGLDAPFLKRCHDRNFELMSLFVDVRGVEYADWKTQPEFAELEQVRSATNQFDRQIGEIIDYHTPLARLVSLDYDRMLEVVIYG